jgi:hypothetical protein
VLAGSDSATVPSATAQVAASWTARRRRRGDSPSAVGAAAAIVFQVGADLAGEVATRPSADGNASGASRSGGRPARRHT